MRKELTFLALAACSSNDSDTGVKTYPDGGDLVDSECYQAFDDIDDSAGEALKLIAVDEIGGRIHVVLEGSESESLMCFVDGIEGVQTGGPVWVFVETGYLECTADCETYRGISDCREEGSCEDEALFVYGSGVDL